MSDLKTHLARNTREKLVVWNGFNQKRNRSVDMTNAEKIRSMSDEELAEFMQKMECSCFVDFIGYADKGCGRNEISCKDCQAKAPTIFEWLQSEAE